MSQTFIHTHSNGFEGQSLYIKPRSRIKIKFNMPDWVSIKAMMFCGVRKVDGTNYETPPVNETSTSPVNDGVFFIGFGSDFDLSKSINNLTEGEFVVGGGYHDTYPAAIDSSNEHIEVDNYRAYKCVASYTGASGNPWGIQSNYNSAGWILYPGLPPASNNLKFWQTQIEFTQGTISTKPQLQARFDTVFKSSIYNTIITNTSLSNLDTYISQVEPSLWPESGQSNLSQTNGSIANPINCFYIYWPFFNHYFVISAIKIVRVS